MNFPFAISYGEGKSRYLQFSPVSTINPQFGETTVLITNTPPSASRFLRQGMEGTAKSHHGKDSMFSLGGVARGMLAASEYIPKALKSAAGRTLDYLTEKTTPAAIHGFAVTHSLEVLETFHEAGSRSIVQPLSTQLKVVRVNQHPYDAIISHSRTPSLSTPKAIPPEVAEAALGITTTTRKKAITHPYSSSARSHHSKRGI